MATRGRDMTLRACIFDLFGTLVPIVKRAEYYAGLHSLARDLGAQEARFLAEWDRTYLGRNIGHFLTLEENTAAVAARLGIPVNGEVIRTALGPFREMVQRALQPKPEAEDVLRRLRDQGYRLGLISNCHYEVPEPFRNGPLASYFHELIFSCEIGMMKPAPKIYQAMARRLKVDPGACLYIGDGHGRELTGASAEGMVTVLVDNRVDDGFVWECDETADHVINDLREVFAILDRSGERDEQDERDSRDERGERA
jgi:putative hydrolase of the HAD superfamily